jgi:SAM-dependent methyltransferase
LSDVTPEQIAERHAALQDARAAELAERVQRFVQPAGDERVLDVGTGVGALALALAPFVREVVAVDVSPERLQLARQRAPANVSFVEADARRLPFERAAFDLAATMRTLHHVARPEYVVAELARVTRPGGHLLVVDQLAPVDPLVAIELDRFERTRDPSHARLLPDIDLRHLFEANGLVLLRARVDEESRDLESYLDLAGCEGDARERARTLAPRAADRVEVGWYFLRKPA